MGVALLCFAASALAQAKGEVESIGFQGSYRPDCWTPLVVKLSPDTPESATYLLQVHQQDMDGDQVVYQRTITLTGQGPGGTSRPQRYWMYFLPQSRRVNGNVGLPQPSTGGSLSTLQEQLKVTLATPSGKFIATLPLTSPANSIEPPRTINQPMRSKRLVLSVSDRSTGFEQPSVTDYANALGLTEDVEFIMLDPDQLPDDPIAYQAIDAIVFLQADPSRLKTPTDERYQAIRSYVQGGGRLVICQSTPWELATEWADLLPVKYPRFADGSKIVQGITTRSSNEPLATLARNEGMNNLPWSRLKPYSVGVAEALPGSNVEFWLQWSATDYPLPAKTPFLVRKPYGAGSVTWVAADLGNAQLTGIVPGWAAIWDRVMGWSNQSMVPDVNQQRYAPAFSNRIKNTYEPAVGIDLGSQLLPELEHGATGAKLVAMAGVFFVAFWLAAGPGSYLALLAKKRAKYSWFTYAAISLVAIAVSMGIVQLALRGDPTIHHFTLVREIPGADSRVQSMIGLYIPQDGQMQLSMPGNVSTQDVSWIAPLTIHPQQVLRQSSQAEFITKLDYSVKVRSLGSADAPELTVPYRTTLKKFRADWAGQLPNNGGIVGNLRLPSPSSNYSALDLEGVVTNGTPYTLSSVYLCFSNAEGQDVLLYIPQWKPAQTLDLINSISWKRLRLRDNQDYKSYALPTDNPPAAIHDYLHGLNQDSLYALGGDHFGWTAYWYSSLRSRAATNSDGNSNGFPYFLPVLSLYDRLPPMTSADIGMFNNTQVRAELLRMGARNLDLSSAISAGNLVVFGKAEGPLPQPFTVNGNPVESTGTILWQSVIPIQRPASANPPPTTAPATKPAPTGMPGPSGHGS